MMSLYAGRSTAGTALERGGFALAYAIWRLRLGLRLCFLEGFGVLEQVNQGVEAFAGAKDKGGREAWTSFVWNMAGGHVAIML
jgi:hypothetical protein